MAVWMLLHVTTMQQLPSMTALVYSLLAVIPVQVRPTVLVLLLTTQKWAKRVMTAMPAPCWTPSKLTVHVQVRPSLMVVLIPLLVTTTL